MMRVQPIWWIGFVVYLIYNAIIYSAWYAVGADYTHLVARDVILTSVVLPLFLGAIFMLGVIFYLGWWRPVMFEGRLGQPRWALWISIGVMLGFIAANVTTTIWSTISGIHLLCLIAAGVLVGFNEEALTRGVLIVSWRGSKFSEVWVWFWSSALFGLLHLPNALFGLPVYGAVAQVFFAFLAGSGFYVIRRIGGTVLIPMLLHGAWDFATFSRGASGADFSAVIPVFQFATYFVSIALVVVVLRHDKKLKTDTR